MNATVEDILRELDARPADGEPLPSALDLLARFDQPGFAAAWEADPSGPRLYRWFVRKLIAQGYPTAAVNLARRFLGREAGRVEHPEAVGDPVLRYLTALAFARGGNPRSAARYATPLVEQVRAAGWEPPPGVVGRDLTAEALALCGRLAKDHARQVPPGPARAALAGDAAEWYLSAAAFAARSAFQLGNAATMRYVQGDVPAAEALAAEALAAATAEAAADPDSYWPAATAAEASLLLGRDADGDAHYEDVVNRMLRRRDRGALAALLPNLRLLSEAGLRFDADRIAARIGGVVVFSGHRIDPPWFAAGGRPPRFPNDPILAAAVKARIAAELDRLNARFGFGSLACGADILFAEAMLDRGADLQVVLPFAERDFLRLSVDYDQPDPAWGAWAARYRGVLGRLSQFRDAVYFATSEPYLGSDQLFAYANDVLQGMTIVRARQLGVVPHALVVLDRDAEPTPGGAAHFRGRWERTGHPAAVIDLGGLRGDRPRAAAGPLPPADPPPVLPRPILAMLFADVAGFSKIHEEFAPDFFRLFPRIVADTLAAAGDRVCARNTWGDGVFAVFGPDPAGGPADASGVAAAADAALRLVAACEAAAAEWRRIGFADPNPVRVGLHAGPVFELSPDPVLGRTNYFGQHVNRTARIEPITLPGSVYASEQFAALLTVAAPDAFACEYVGVEPLAKNYSTAPLYQLRPAPPRPAAR